MLGSLEVEHLIPRSGGGADDELNLWLAGRPCNQFKSAQIEALNAFS